MTSEAEEKNWQRLTIPAKSFRMGDTAILLASLTGIAYFSGKTQQSHYWKTLGLERAAPHLEEAEYLLNGAPVMILVVLLGVGLLMFVPRRAAAVNLATALVFALFIVFIVWLGPGQQMWIRAALCAAPLLFMFLLLYDMNKKGRTMLHAWEHFLPAFGAHAGKVLVAIVVLSVALVAVMASTLLGAYAAHVAIKAAACDCGGGVELRMTDPAHALNNESVIFLSHHDGFFYFLEGAHANRIVWVIQDTHVAELRVVR